MMWKPSVLTVSLVFCLAPLTPVGAAQGTRGNEGAAQVREAQGEPQATSEGTGASLEERVRREVEELHRFFQQWFNGTVPDTDEAFARFAEVLADGMVIVSPDGRLRERDEVFRGLRSAYAPEGSEPVRVWVENVQLRRHLPSPDGDLVVVTYEEWLQRGETKRGRISSALLRAAPETPNGLEWLHLHETWLPPAEEGQ
jgi:hypothetical protein